MTRLRYLRQVSTLEVDRDICTGCCMCLDVCPHAVFELDTKKPEVVDLDACMECGACIQNCEVGAIMVRKGTGCATAYIMSSMSEMNKQRV